MVKHIALTQGKVAIVDDEDFEYLNQWKWYAQRDPTINGSYAARQEYMGSINGKQKKKLILMHRLIMNCPPRMYIDHINHDRLDNRKENLRIVSNRQNQQNSRRTGVSKYRGVSWSKWRNKWVAAIQIDGKQKHLGSFDDEKEAAKAYEKACRDIGEELVCKMKGDLWRSKSG